VSSLERTLAVGLGLIVGLALGWLLRALRPARPDTRVEEELRGQLGRQSDELSRLRTASTDVSSARAAAESSQRAAEESLAATREQLSTARTEASRWRTDLEAERIQLAAARADAEAQRQLLAEQRRFHTDNERELRDTHARMVAELRAQHERAVVELKTAFGALSAEALKQTAPEFLRLANETFARFQETAKGDLTAREERVAALVKPLEEQLRTYQQRLQQSEAGQATALGDVKRHLEQLASQSQTLSSETQRLRVVLSSNQARGRWGEETLRRIVEASGMSPHCDFTEQVRQGESQPDLLVRLPGDRLIVIDSKVPDLQFLDSLNAADEVARSRALADHAASLRSTIKALADRDYPAQFPQALDHVVLFVPAESLFSAALEADHDLIVWAAERHILVATPTSLIALLRSVAVSWQQFEQSRNAREIAAASQQLFERVTKFVEHFERIRDGLLKANRAYDDAVGSYERMVRPAGNRLLGLGVAAAEPPQEIAPLNPALRLPPAA
jgi:DNA recombination protein RmuC